VLLTSCFYRKWPQSGDVHKLAKYVEAIGTDLLKYGKHRVVQKIIITLCRLPIIFQGCQHKIIIVPNMRTLRRMDLCVYSFSWNYFI
jgi:hypothetical protein